MLLQISVVAAEIYTWRDEQGGTHYSDRGTQEAKIVDVIPGYAYFDVKKVVDGDTVVLSHGEKIRLLGINTPEVARKDKPAEAGGETAKSWLRQQVAGKKVRLQKDLSKRDKYGRTLAHLFTQDGTHLNLLMLQRGLGTVNIYPPNLQYAEQFIIAQQQAETGHLGIWQLPAYAVENIRDINALKQRGWRRLLGEIQAIRQRRKYTYLEFTENFSARIHNQNLALFVDVQQYVGKQVELRGWVKRNKTNYSMLLRHPSTIIILD
jgi:micrococcal nuclease